MEARATINGASISKTFVAAVLVLVAMGLGAMGGYVAKGMTGGASVTGVQQVHPAPGTVLRQDNPPAGAVQPNRFQKDDASTVNAPVHPAPGTVLRQDNPPAGAVELPAYIQNEINGPQADPRLSQDDPAFIQKYAQKSATDDNAVIGTRGDHGELQ